VGLPCCLNGARGLVREAEKKLGTKSGTATADGRFAIVEVMLVKGGSNVQTV
jgi:NADH:ubiquinone oxidoreductase subunit E